MWRMKFCGIAYDETEDNWIKCEHNAMFENTHCSYFEDNFYLEFQKL